MSEQTQINCYVILPSGATKPVLAVSDNDARLFGCPYCGTTYEFGLEEAVIYRNSRFVLCTKCCRGYLVLGGACTMSEIGISGIGHPPRSPHPFNLAHPSNRGPAVTNRGGSSTVVPTTNRRPLVSGRDGRAAPPAGGSPDGAAGC